MNGKSIQDEIKEIKGFWTLKTTKEFLLITLGICAIFGLGYAAGAKNRPQIALSKLPDSTYIVQTPALKEAQQESALQAGEYVASINGSRYYPLDCKASNRISEHNRVWFASHAEAELEGYTQSPQCTY